MGRPSTVVLCAVVALVTVGSPTPWATASASVPGALAGVPEATRLRSAAPTETPAPPAEPATPGAADEPSPVQTPAPAETPAGPDVDVAPPDARESAVPRPVEDLLVAALADVDRIRTGTAPDAPDVDAPPAMVAAAQEDREEFAAEGLAITESATTLVGAVVVTRTGDRQVVEAGVLTELVTRDGTGEDVLAHWSRTHRFTVEDAGGTLRLVADEVVEPAPEPAVGEPADGSSTAMRLIALLPVLLVLLALTALVTGASLVLRRRAHPWLLAAAGACAVVLLAAAGFATAPVQVGSAGCMGTMAVDDVPDDGDTMTTSEIPHEDRLACRDTARRVVGGWTLASLAAVAGLGAAVRRSARPSVPTRTSPDAHLTRT
ncbi:hypothetical protein [Cellulomonas oligotrophica]|uniref:Uncharacterized protein n=1 Tax=Cellulomonas oligotrophica TaxID=931536 RepID=A0A7Y9FGL3_9CELL|nr:hypothetical protein [Cellulomonas oligotrophica]NYD86864.1 hypothetical protein [Cellulomonas oligotrophica]GIG32350.1 hypothetical protein Col01nite_15090 [Cellulomonas oligotrophica]